MLAFYRMTEEISAISLNSVLGDIDRHEVILEIMEELTKLAAAHIKHMYIFGCDELNADSPCLLLADDPDYIPPTKHQVQLVVDFLMNEKKLTKADIALKLNVSPKNNRTINYWLAENRKENIPYGAWRLLLSMAGLSIDLMHFSDAVKSKILK
ncbi:hypothetical protein [Photobacterium leiognathi]|uniref:hypothetical protein n=1 Tax=Photobacterium leiognathi TaxID=553611 RepID=UPI002980C413|nr:hypothetical protein [Photobacterium leiognathi]